jgi:hypothetical protein
MASKRALQHAGASSAIANAPPDPSESNGAPDDGYTGTWCENLAFASGSSSGAGVTATVYSGWQDSSSHNACMKHSDMNSAGVGMQFNQNPCPGANSQGCWWVVLDLSRDRTPPGSAPAAKASTPKPAATSAPQAQSQSLDSSTNDAPPSDEEVGVAGTNQTPEPEASPTPTATPEPENERGVGEVFTEATEESGTKPSGLGVREYAAIAVLLLFALFVLLLARRRI